MNRILFTNVRVFDGSGSAPFPADVLVVGQHIEAIASPGQLPQDGCERIDGAGATLMPGLVEAHAHLSWPSSVERMVHGMSLPPEQLVLTTARNARILLDHGFTSAYSAGALNRHVEPALRDQIDSGGMPGPRLIPSSIEREPGASNEALVVGHVEEHGAGPAAIRAFVLSCAAEGAKSVKVLLSGEDALMPGASQQLLYSDEEVAAAAQAAREGNVWLAAHAQADRAVQLALKHEFRVLYHCTYASPETIDQMAAAKDRIFVAPAIGIIQATLDANPPPHIDMKAMKESAAEVLALQKELIPELHRRGVRVLPGGDYGFPFNPNGRNARDMELFVSLFGFTPTEALVAATRIGGELMDLPVGQVKQGFLADLLLVDGDPTQDVRVLQDRSRLLAVMKDGQFHRAPPRALVATRVAEAVA